MNNEKEINRCDNENKIIEEDDGLINVVGGIARSFRNEAEALIKDRNILIEKRPFKDNLDSDELLRSQDTTNQNNLFDGRPSPKSKTTHKNNQ